MTQALEHVQNHDRRCEIVAICNTCKKNYCKQTINTKTKE